MDERRQVTAEARAAGRGLSGFGFDSTMLYYDGDGSPSEQIASAEGYAQRLHTRAAQVLNAQQLKAFDDMQAIAVMAMRGQAEKRDTP